MINLINQYMLFGLILSLVRAFVMHPMIHIENNIVQHNDWLFSIWFQVLRNLYFFCYPIYFINFSNASHIISSSQLMIFKKKSRFLLAFLPCTAEHKSSTFILVFVLESTMNFIKRKNKRCPHAQTNVTNGTGTYFDLK